MRLLAFVCVMLTGFASFAEAGIEDDVTQAMKHPRPYDTRELAEVSAAHFIFVDGIFGAQLKKNFIPAATLIRQDWKNSNVTILRPSTAVPIPENAERIYEAIRTVRAGKLEKPGVLVAHSKGGAEALLMLLRHPNIIRDLNLHSVVIVSAPIQGTDFDPMVANCDRLDYLCKAFDRKLPSLRYFLPEIINPLFQSALAALNTNDRALLAKTIFYVRTQINFYDVISPVFVPSLLIAGNLDGANDGLIPTAHELLRDLNGNVFGTDLGIMRGDHNSLLNQAMRDETKKFRTTFFKVLMRDSYLRSQ